MDGQAAALPGGRSVSRRPVLIIRVHRGNRLIQFPVFGERAAVLKALVSAGSRGIAAQDSGRSTLALGAHIHQLRRYHGLRIRVVRRPHKGSPHTRYVLVTPVEIVLESPGKSKRVRGAAHV
jgi:hypothetical protein